MPTDIELEEVRSLVAKGAQLIEALPAGEYEEEHVPGAINIPFTSLNKDAVTNLDRSKPVIVYCWDDA